MVSVRVIILCVWELMLKAERYHGFFRRLVPRQNIVFEVRGKDREGGHDDESVAEGPAVAAEEKPVVDLGRANNCGEFGWEKSSSW